MNHRFRIPALAAAFALALALAGCGKEEGGNPPTAPDQDAAHAGHADHAPPGGAAGTDADVTAPDEDPDISRPEAPDTPVYTLEAEVEQREDGCYLLVDTNLKLSRENYGRSPVEGEGHIHLYVNGSLIGPITDLEPVPLRNLKEGENVVRVELAQNNHSVIAGTSKSVRFEYAPPVSDPPGSPEPPG